MLDSTLVSLSLKIFDWAIYRQHKGAMKLHTLLDYQGAMPVFIHLTDGKVYDATVAREMSIPKGSVLVCDRGYLDYELLNDWEKNKQVRFVVRNRKRMSYRVIKDLPAGSSNILKDQIIELTNFYPRKKYTSKLRRVEVWDNENKKIIILITNQTKSWTAETISQLYKARWQIEIFFKEIKQHLKIKSFVGTTINAVLTQIWTAMITLLLLKYLKAKAKFNWNLSNLVSFIRFNLLVNVNLFSWLDEPIFTQLRGSPMPNQLFLFNN